MKQAKSVSEDLKTESITTVYSSSLDRALYLAIKFSSEHHIECIRDNQLIEMNYGVFEDKLRSDEDYLKEKRKFFVDIRKENHSC